MNFKTTLVLLLLVAAVAVLGAAYLIGPDQLPSWLAVGTPAPAPSPTLHLLETEFTADRVTRIEVAQGDRHLVLGRGAGGEWSLPGQWPTRKAEVEGLVSKLTSLRSRFTPETVGEAAAGLDRYGLDHPAVVVTLHAGDTDYHLAFAEKDAVAGTETEAADRFSRPTWLRIDDRPEVVRLAPGIIAALDRPVDYYQQRRLFPSERVAKETGSPDKVDRLAAQSVSVADKRKDGTGSYTLTRSGDTWDLSQPVHDHVDPEKLKSILGAAPDIWADVFVERGSRGLADFGLQEPEQSLSITRSSGDTMTLLIGKLSPTVRERKIAPPAPPPGMPFPPQPPQTVKDEYRYAKLANNDQLFEIRAEPLKALFVSLKDLRDARLARFKSEDARRVEVNYAGQTVLLVKEKDAWHLDSPTGADAETGKVNELLDKLSGLEARDADVIDNADPTTYGFADPTKANQVRVTVEEEKGEGEAKKKARRIVAFFLGKDDPAKKKLYVRTEGLPRVNAVDDSLVTLAKRPALAYRGRRILDFAIGDVEQIDVHHGKEAVVLKQDKGTWKLAGPTTIDADAGKAGSLAGSLGTLEAVTYLNDVPKPEDLEKYGLAKDPLSAALLFKPTSKKTAQTLLVGKAIPDKAGEFYAKLAAGPSVFAVKKDVHDALEQGALAYRPLDLWHLTADDISGLRIHLAGQDEYRLTRQASAWLLAGPFEATAQATMVEPMLSSLAALHAERYEAAASSDLKKYGLDTPHLQVALALNPSAGKERTLLVGKATDGNAEQHYAKLADGDAIFVVGNKLTSAVDHGALDLLDRRLLTLGQSTIQQVLVTAATPFALERKDNAWQVTQSPAPAPYPADNPILSTFLFVWSDLQAQHFAAYGPKADLAKFGLEKPATTLTVTVQPPEANGKKPPVERHTLAIGKEVEGSAGQRYGRLDNGPGVAVLPTFVTRALTHDYLDFVNHSLWKFDSTALSSLKRQAGADTLEIAKKDDWHILKPAAFTADGKVMQGLAGRLAGLRAVRIAAYPAKDLKSFGLDAPAAVVTLQAGADKAGQHVIRIGKVVDAVAGSGDPATTPRVVAGSGDPATTPRVAGSEDPATTPRTGPRVVAGSPDPATRHTADRFAQVQGSQAVAVIDGALAEQLLAAPIRFRDRAIARFTDADKVLLERGPRKATFANIDGTWKLTEPLAAPAEQTELDDFINALARLHADEMVAEKPADLKPYGLDKPQAQWRFLSGTKEVLNLQVGARDKSGRSYAKLAAGDVVFLLDATTTKRVLAEYRSRTIWPSALDAAQVEAAHFGYAQKPFTLDKIDNVWHVAGKPDVLVNVKTVDDALDALARLKVERYVLDKGADPKLYGLEPPLLALEIQTRDGKRTLHIGRTEGDSKRYYAQVPGKDRSDVFLISDAEGARILRDLPAFSDKLAKPVKPGKP